MHAVLGEQEPEVQKQIEIIIKNNGEKVTATINRAKNKDAEGLNEDNLIDNNLLNRKTNDARVYMYNKAGPQKGLGDLEESDVKNLKEDYANLPGEKIQQKFKEKIKEPPTLATNGIAKIESGSMSGRDDDKLQSRELMVYLSPNTRTNTKMIDRKLSKPEWQLMQAIPV